jgi:hypothetical protein
VVANQTVTSGGTLRISLSTSTNGGSALSYSARALMTDPTAQAVYNLDQQLQLARSSSYRDNARGWQERYLSGSNGRTYFIVPNGTLYQYTGGSNLAKNPVVTTLTRSYYINLAALYNASVPGMITVPASSVSVSVSSNTLTIHPAATFTGVIQITTAVSNRQGSAVQTFNVTVGGASANRTASVSDAWSDTPPAVSSAPSVSGLGMRLAALDAFYAQWQRPN